MLRAGRVVLVAGLLVFSASSVVAQRKAAPVNSSLAPVPAPIHRRRAMRLLRGRSQHRTGPVR